jgi:TonB family protein
MAPLRSINPIPSTQKKDVVQRCQAKVVLSLTVGTDGLAHDVMVTKSLGHRLDEKALVSVQQWQFEPAAENGKPIPARITIEVDFSIDK